MTIGSIAGTLLGGLLLGVVPTLILIPLLVLLLLLSAVKESGDTSRPNRRFPLSGAKFHARAWGQTT